MSRLHIDYKEERGKVQLHIFTPKETLLDTSFATIQVPDGLINNIKRIIKNKRVSGDDLESFFKLIGVTPESQGLECVQDKMRREWDVKHSSGAFFYSYIPNVKENGGEVNSYTIQKDMDSSDEDDMVDVSGYKEDVYAGTITKEALDSDDDN